MSELTQLTLRLLFERICNSERTPDQHQTVFRRISSEWQAGLFVHPQATGLGSPEPFSRAAFSLSSPGTLPVNTEADPARQANDEDVPPQVIKKATC